MDSTVASNTMSTNHLFDVYLRLRQPQCPTADQFLEIEAIEEAASPTASDAAQNSSPDAAACHHMRTRSNSKSHRHLTHITIRPPASDFRKRAIEKFGFTRVFPEAASQRDVFDGTGVVEVLEGILGGGHATKSGRDGLIATLGVTNSGKSHTILGSRSQRGLIQMSLDVLFQNLAGQLADPSNILHELATSDVSEAQLVSALALLDPSPSDGDSHAAYSRAHTPMPNPKPLARKIYNSLCSHGTAGLAPCSASYRTFAPPSSTLPGSFPEDETSETLGARKREETLQCNSTIRSVTSQTYVTASTNEKLKLSPVKEQMTLTPSPTKSRGPQLSSLPPNPRIDNVKLPVDSNAEYAIVVSMYEVYNDRIFDLLNGQGTPTTSHSHQLRRPIALAKDLRRRPLLFKSTEYSPDRKVVAGLRKVVCGSLEQALLVLETGLIERRVAGTGSNATSSRSHGFFCVEVKKRRRGSRSQWLSHTLSIVDLAGSERARTAKTAGATLAEAGKINESLMYLGQCMQMQSDNTHQSALFSGATSQPLHLVPFRQCKLTELLFSNSFASNNAQTSRHAMQHTQKAIMIVTADPRGDFNATSQILRYSALAREVTVPRIPSVKAEFISGAGHTSTISATGSVSTSRPATATSSCSNGSSTYPPTSSDEMSSELELLRHALSEETARRIAAEQSWALSESRLEQQEADIRAECWDTFEQMLERERRRWREERDELLDRAEEFTDGKVGIVSRHNAFEHTNSANNAPRFSIYEDEPSDLDVTIGPGAATFYRNEDESQVLHDRMSGVLCESTHSNYPAIPRLESFSSFSQTPQQTLAPSPRKSQRLSNKTQERTPSLGKVARLVLDRGEDGVEAGSPEQSSIVTTDDSFATAVYDLENIEPRY